MIPCKIAKLSVRATTLICRKNENMKAEEKRIGVAVNGHDANEIVRTIKYLEEIGIQAAWLTTGGAGRDGLTVFAAAAIQTSHILLGTSIIPTWPRHPVSVAQQVRVLEELAPGRFRLGIGPSHRDSMQRLIGTDFKAPLGHLREYIQILKALIQEGEVDFDGSYYRAHAQTGAKLSVPVMASALRVRSFELCGAEADGAITWLCPGPYLQQVAIPALEAGAQQGHRSVPPLIAHAPVCVHDNHDEVRIAMREQMGHYPSLPFYAQMLAESGFPEVVQQNAWSDAAIDLVVLSGNEEQVEARLRGMFEFGAKELVLSLVLAGEDRERCMERTLNLLSKVASSLN